MELIFDFDGTLVDSFQCVVDKFSQIAHEFNIKPLTLAEINKLRDYSSKELIQFLDIPLYQLPKMLLRMRKLMHAEIKHLAPIADLPEVLNIIYNAGHPMRILTSNSRENVLLWLKTNELEHLFTHVHCEAKFFSKSRRLKRILRAHGINKLQAFYIGDETRDIEAASLNGIRSIAVTWGYNSETILAKSQPSFIARSPKDILRICEL